MGVVTWLGGNDRRPADALGYLAEVVAESARGVFVVVIDSDGLYHLRAFGDVLKSDTALVAAMLTYEAARQMFGDEEG